MDKAEYQLKLEELTMYADRQDYKNALRVVNSIDWRRVKSIRTLNMVADIYEVNKDYKSCKEILLLAYDRASIGKSILYRLTEISLKLGEMSEAEDFYQEYASVAANDNSRYLLQYKIKKAQRAPLEAQIAVLEQYKEREYTERWAYELASLYHKAGDKDKCLETCDDLILWFSEGKYVVKAMELKMKYEPLTPSQQKLYDQERYLYPTKGRGTKAEKDQGQEKDQEDSQAGQAQGASGGKAWDPSFRGGQASALKTDLAYGVQTSRDLMERLDQAGAAITKDVAVEEKKDSTPLMGDAVDEYPVTSREFMGKTANLREQLAKSIHDVFSGVKKDAPHAEDLFQGEGIPSEPPVEASAEFLAEPSVESPVEPFAESYVEPSAESSTESSVESSAESDILPEDFPVKDLEPEEVSEASAEASGEISGGTSEAIPAESPADQAGEDQVEGQTSFEDFDLDALLRETASSFSQEIATGTAEAEGITLETTEMAAETAEPVEAATETAEMAAAEAVEPTAAAATETGESAVETEEFTAAAEGKPEFEESETAAEVAVAAETAVEADAAAAEETKDVEENLASQLEMALNQEVEEPKKVHYNEELEIPDPEPTLAEKMQRTIPLNKIGQNTVPISIEDVLREETPEERRIRILNDAKPTRMSDEQRKIFTYFARVPGMDQQILEAIGDVYAHAGEHNSMHGNIAVMGAEGTGKSRLSYGLIVAMCKDLGLDAAKVARLKGSDINQKDPAKIVNKMAGGFLVIEEAGDMIDDKVKCLNQAMEFRTDCMILVIEDEKSRMRALLKKHPEFAAKFDKVISIPVFTNDELVTFARTYATENGCKMDEMGVLALYTLIGNNQSEQEPVTISRVKEMVDDAIHRAKRGKSKFGKRGASKDREHWTILHEKDFES